MNRTVTIHQVNYLPWIGFFNKVKQADVYVMFDIADYEKNKFQNRNKIRTRSGWTYLTIPIERKYYRIPFHKVMLPKSTRWKDKHWKSIYYNYAKAEYFHSFRGFFEHLYKSRHKTLMNLNEEIILYLLEQFEINVEIVKCTNLEVDRTLTKTDLLIDILDKTHADIYLSGGSGESYLEQKKFTDHNIKLRFQRFVHPVYRQRFAGFIPNMSAIDLLFNMGEHAKHLI